MDKITKSEYKILRRCASKPREFDEKLVWHLIRIQYLVCQDTALVGGVSVPTSRVYKITHAGMIACEHYHDHVFERRMVSFRAWLALALSAISIVVTVIHLFFF